MKLMVLDGNSLAYRAFFALPTDMVTASGQVTNSVFGFTSMLLSVMKDHKPDSVIVVFDRKEPTFRHEAAPEYKAQRISQPDILYQQLDIIREVLTALGIQAIDAAGFEGDDLIATIANRADREDIDVLIVTGDRDTFQLVKDPHIRVMYNLRGVSEYALYDESGIVNRTGVTPNQYADYAALRGDPSDNLDGVPGVGEKTAAKLINKYQTLVAVFDHAQDQTPKLRASLLEHRDRVLRNAELMVLRRDAPVDIDVRDCVPRPNMSAVTSLFQILEFRNMAARMKEALKYLNLDFGSVPTGPVSEASKSNTAEIVAQVHVVSEVDDAVSVFSGSGPTCIAATWTELNGRPTLSGMCVVTDVDTSKVSWIPIRLFEDQKVGGALTHCAKLRGHDLKPMIREMLQIGVDIVNIDLDTAIAAYLLDPSQSRYELADLLGRYSERVLVVEGSEKSGQLNFEAGLSASESVERFAHQAIAVAYLSIPLVDALAAQGVEKLYRTVELPLVRVLARMEQIGVGVDVSQLRAISAHLRNEVDRLTAELYQVAGITFNLNSPKQLGEILYTTKGLAPPRKTKTGFSTDAATLDLLRAQWPEFIEPLLQYREFEKLRSTYGEGLIQAVGSDGRIHATFNQTVARTGRLSSDQPNLHNIPVRSEEGRVFRKAFVPSQGHQLLVADYNQIELRCIAHLANDPGLIDAFVKGIDIHKVTAASVFGVTASEVTYEQRSQAKMVSYGLAYGMEAYGLSQRLGIGVSEASEILEAYFRAFPNVKEYMDATVAEARKRGFTETIFGRRRPIPELHNSNFRIRQAGERQAMNSGIQGLAADIFKIALVRIDHDLEEAQLSSRLILQVHDEVLVEAVIDEKNEVEKLVLSAMKGAATLIVPLEVNAAWGDSWASAKV
ncbi:MAG: DNA polymerase I [Ilumatobacteraceae bacterium]